MGRLFHLYRQRLGGAKKSNPNGLLLITACMSRDIFWVGFGLALAAGLRTAVALRATALLATALLSLRTALALTLRAGLTLLAVLRALRLRTGLRCGLVQTTFFAALFFLVRALLFSGLCALCTGLCVADFVDAFLFATSHFIGALIVAAGFVALTLLTLLVALALI